MNRSSSAVSTGLSPAALCAAAGPGGSSHMAGNAGVGRETEKRWTAASSSETEAEVGDCITEDDVRVKRETPAAGLWNTEEDEAFVS